MDFKTIQNQQKETLIDVFLWKIKNQKEYIYFLWALLVSSAMKYIWLEMDGVLLLLSKLVLVITFASYRMNG